MLASLRATGALSLLLIGSSGGLFGCDKALGRQSSDDLARSNAASAASKVETPPAGGPMTRFEPGTDRAGSIPGTPLRDPTREADLVPIAIDGFEIDRAPFPNDASSPELTQADFAGASAQCESRGKRLCSELEWEHACNQAGVEAFTAGAREWTLSDGTDALASTRGGSGQGSARCGARTSAERTARLGFRCCRGATPKSAYPAPPASEPSALGARPLELSLDAMRKALADVKELAALAPSFQPFSSSDADAALRKGKRSRDGITAWTFLPSATAWTPAPGDELIVLAGQSGAQALIAVLYPLGDGTYAHAASAILREQDATVALAQRVVDPTPRELLWTSCYGCPNEGGAIRYGDDRRVVIEFR